MESRQRLAIKSTKLHRCLAYKYKNIVLVGDNFGLPQLIRYVPWPLVKGIVAASIRPQYIEQSKILANKLGVDLLIQPKYNTRQYEKFYNSFVRYKFDLLLCCSYSMIIRPDVLRSLNYNAVNVHSALLPKNRGPNPIQWALIKGEVKTGITMHYMSDYLDAGDIIAQRIVKILPKDTWVSLSKRMSVATNKLLKNNIPQVLLGINGRIPQDEDKATTNIRLTPASPRIDFEAMNDIQIYNLIRAQVKPLKGAYIDKKNGRRQYIDEFTKLEDIKELRRGYTTQR